MASPTELRQVADEIRTEASQHPRVAQAWLIGGQRRVVRVTLDREKLALRIMCHYCRHMAR